MTFKRICLIAKKRTPQTLEAIQQTIRFFDQQPNHLIIEKDLAHLSTHATPALLEDDQPLYKQADLVICIGGDGTLLNAARDLAPNPIPLIGIDLGRLGFLVDIPSDQLEPYLSSILAGHYDLEERCMISLEVKRDDQIIFQDIALNEAVIYKAEAARMIEFDCFIDQRFLTKQRSDGMIITTPTGSTAYALSAGGPIISPDLPVFGIISICPHTMSQRPIVISNQSIIEIESTCGNSMPAIISCDAVSSFELQAHDRVKLSKHDKSTLLIHPKQHDHFFTLRHKLDWGGNNLRT